MDFQIYFRGANNNQDPCDDDKMDCAGGGQITNIKVYAYGPNYSTDLIYEKNVTSKCCYNHWDEWGLSPSCNDISEEDEMVFFTLGEDTIDNWNFPYNW